MEIYLELNRRFGRGFQVRITHGPMDKTYDHGPLDMYTAGAYAGTLLEMVNKEMGADYKPHQVLRVTNEALEVNAKTDFAAARMLQDQKHGKYALSTPGGRDFKRQVIDGEEQYLLSGRGVVLFCCSTWRDEGNQRARDALRRYCEYICAHGCKGGASKALAELDALDQDGAAEWIRRTYACHVHDDGALIAYVMGR